MSLKVQGSSPQKPLTWREQLSVWKQRTVEVVSHPKFPLYAGAAIATVVALVLLKSYLSQAPVHGNGENGEESDFPAVKPAAAPAGQGEIPSMPALNPSSEGTLPPATPSPTPTPAAAAPSVPASNPSSEGTLPPATPSPTPTPAAAAPSVPPAPPKPAVKLPAATPPATQKPAAPASAAPSVTQRPNVKSAGAKPPSQ